MAIYLNTYETWESYGGPEEGGWWFECGTPVQSIKISEENLEHLQEQRDQKQDNYRFRWMKMCEFYREEPEGEKKDKLSKIIENLEDAINKTWKEGRLPELNRMANEINKAFTEEREITVKCKETGGYQFVVSSPDPLGMDDEDPTPSAYYGDQKYKTEVESHFAEFFPQEKPRYE